VRRLAVLAAVALVAGCGGGDDGPAPPPGKSLATQRALTPTAHLFADPVEARLDVIVDRERLDPDRVRLRVDFLPYRMVDGLRRSRDDYPRFTRLRFEATLRCLTVACIPQRLGSILGDQEGRGERRTFRFDPARVLYDDPATGRTRNLRRVWWPPLDSISRLATVNPELRFLAPGAELEATLAPVREPDSTVPPWLLAAALLAAAAAALSLPAVRVARWHRARRPQQEPVSPLSALERALLQVERARDDEARRDALEALALELDGDGGAPHARDARRLAWSPERPEPDEAARLLAAVREAHAAPS
jgi:hypothetical protein